MPDRYKMVEGLSDNWYLDASVVDTTQDKLTGEYVVCECPTIDQATLITKLLNQASRRKEIIE